MENMIICNGIEYKTKFKVGDVVQAENYGGVLVLDCVDEFLTKASKKLHWETTSVDYLQGNSKTNNGESYSDNELKHIPI